MRYCMIGIKALIVCIVLVLSSPSLAEQRIHTVWADPSGKLGTSVIVWTSNYAMERRRPLLLAGQPQAAAKYAACIVDEGTKVEFFGTAGDHGFPGFWSLKDRKLAAMA
jgi:hypothetical protein